MTICQRTRSTVAIQSQGLAKSAYLSSLSPSLYILISLLRYGAVSYISIISRISKYD
nr:MAG TPA: hypothetical protein [Caudoviricetes sp.]